MPKKVFIILGIARRRMKVPQFIPSVHLSTKPFSLGFTFDTLKVWNELPDDISSATSFLCFRKILKAYLFTKSSDCLCGVDSDFCVSGL